LLAGFNIVTAIVLYTSNLSEAHVMLDSSGPATSLYSNKILMPLERVLKFEASLWKTPCI